MAMTPSRQNQRRRPISQRDIENICDDTPDEYSDDNDNDLDFEISNEEKELSKREEINDIEDFNQELTIDEEVEQ